MIVESFEPVTTTSIFMERDLYNSIMDYCQIKIECQELSRDILYEDTYDEDQNQYGQIVTLTKKDFNKGLKCGNPFNIYIPFSDEELKIISRIKEYDEKIKKIIKSGQINDLNNYEYVLSTFYTDSDEILYSTDGQEKYYLQIYDHTVRIYLEDISKSNLNDLYFNLLWVN